MSVDLQKPMKAFIVSDGEEGACICFARHSVAARRDGANELNTDFEAVSCRRAPQFDQYAEAGEVPASVLVDHGWWFECMQCGQKVCDDPYDSEGDPVQLDPVFTPSGQIFCRPSCKDACAAERAEEKARGEAAAQAALAKWPGIEICSTNGYENPGRVWFKFPGGLGQADWTQGAKTIWVESRDQPAWIAFEDSIKAARLSQPAGRGEQR